jgi:glucose-6-phosphatase
LFVTITTLLALSRMYLGCHFFHQCAVGLILGVLVALAVLRNKLNAKLFTIRNRKSTLYAAIFVFVALSTYWIQKVINVDPLWSIKMVRN